MCPGCVLDPMGSRMCLCLQPDEKAPRHTCPSLGWEGAGGVTPVPASPESWSDGTRGRNGVGEQRESGGVLQMDLHDEGPWDAGF